MSPPVATGRTGFTLRVPESWWEFDVWRATRTGDLARLVDARIAQTPQLATHRGGLVKALRLAAEHAERHGARFCAVATDVVDDAGMLVATAMVFHTDGSPDPAGNTVEAIAAQVHAVAQTPDSPRWRRVELVRVPAGRAVRISGVEITNLGGTPVDTVVTQTLVPVPGGNGVLSLVLTSPQVRVAEAMLDLFAAISDTLDWSEEDRPKRTT